MTTQISTPSLQATNVSAQTISAAGRPVHAGAFQLAQQAADQAELRKRAVAEKEAAEEKAAAQAENATQPAAEATTEATTTPATEAAAAETSAAAATGAAATQGAATTSSSSFNPWLVAASVVGVAAVAAAASGGSDDNNSASKGTTTTDSTQSGGGTDSTTTGSGANTGSNTSTDAGTGSNTSTDTQPTQPTQPTTPVANPIAEGELNEPVVANNQITDLNAGTFTAGLSNATNRIKIEKIEAAEGSDPDGRIYRTFQVEGGEQTNAYEVIRVDGSLSWAEAQARATALGGKLLVIDNEAEAEFLRANLSGRLAHYQADGAPWDYAGLAGGAWVGLSQSADAATPNAGWTWANGAAFSAEDWAKYGYKLGDQTLPTDGDPAAGVTENNAANNGAISIAWDAAKGDVSGNMLYDYGGKLSLFVIEYEAYEQPLKLTEENADGTKKTTALVDGQIVANDHLDNLSWSSVFNNGGKITFVEVDSEDKAVGESKTVTLTEKPAATAATGYGESAAALSLKADVASLLDDNALSLI